MISTAEEEDEQEANTSKVEAENSEQKKTDIDKIFDLVHDLKQKDLDEHKRKIAIEQQQQNSREDIHSSHLEPEKEKEKKMFNFKYLTGISSSSVRVLNLGKPEDLEKVLVPTKSMKVGCNSRDSFCRLTISTFIYLD